MQCYGEFNNELKKYNRNITKLATAIQNRYYQKFIAKKVKMNEIEWYFRPHVYKLQGIYLSKNEQKTTILSVMKYFWSIHPKQLLFLYNRFYEDKYAKVHMPNKGAK